MNGTQPPPDPYFTEITPPPDVEDEDGLTTAEYQVSPELLQKLPPGRRLQHIKTELYERWANLDPVEARRELMRARFNDDVVGNDAVWEDMRYAVVYRPDGILEIKWIRHGMRDYTKAKFQKIIDQVKYVLLEAAFPRRIAREELSRVSRRKGLPEDLTRDVMKKYLGGRRTRRRINRVRSQRRKHQDRK